MSVPAEFYTQTRFTVIVFLLTRSFQDWNIKPFIHGVGLLFFNNRSGLTGLGCRAFSMLQLGSCQTP